MHCTKALVLTTLCCIPLQVRDFRTLRVLSMCNCDTVAPAVLTPALESCLCLEELALDSCPLLNQLALSLPRLRKISLRACRALAEARPGSSWLTLCDMRHELRMSTGLTAGADCCVVAWRGVGLACAALTLHVHC